MTLAGTEPGGRPGVVQLVMTGTEDRVMPSPDPSIRQRPVGALMPLGTPNGRARSTAHPRSSPVDGFFVYSGGNTAIPNFAGPH
jgi:hypothetical protein